MANEVLIKIDRNGTKYYADYTCKRCGGAGQRSEWYYTGLVCYECGGTGRAPSPSLRKEYTPEYAAALEERRAEREAQKRGYASAQAMREAQEAEAARREAQRIAEEEARKAEEERREAERKAAAAVSQYVGSVGDKLAITCKYVGSPHFERRSFSGYGTETCYIHTFLDPAGNKLVWKTTSYISLDEGVTVTVSGTVKEHSEYKDEKQTSLIRCKVKAA